MPISQSSPSGQPRVNVADIETHALQRRRHRIDDAPRIFVVCSVAGKALFLVVDDQPWSARPRHLTSATPQLCVPGKPEPGKEHGFAMSKLIANTRQTFIGEVVSSRSSWKPILPRVFRR